MNTQVLAAPRAGYPRLRTTFEWIGCVTAVCCAIFATLNLPVMKFVLDWFGTLEEKTPELPQVHSATAAIPHGAIVFVHGLAAKPKEAWTHRNGTSWMDLMGADAFLGQYDIYYYDYRSDRFANRTRVEDVVGALRRHIDGDLAKYHHLVIVAHSLGGVVARNALEQSKLGSRRGQVVTLVTCGSPFEGSDWADVLRTITKQTSKYIDVLSTTSALQETRDVAWDRLREECGPRLYHLAAYEEKRLGVDVVVKKDSATRDARASAH